MGLGDWIRNAFSKKANPGLSRLEAFAAEHRGVEGFIEPQTATQPTTLLLVDRDGDHLRAPVREPEEGAAWCRRHGIPVYDAQVVGYPDRMRDFDVRRHKPVDASLDEQFADLERRLREEPDADTPNN